MNILFTTINKKMKNLYTTPEIMKTFFDCPKLLRHAIRSGNFNGQTSGQASGFAQANLCILPKEYAFDFLLFCVRNPKPCPLLYVLEAGDSLLGDIDIRTDVPKYRVFENGELKSEVSNISSMWREDFVTFVIGCSFSFEDAMQQAGLSIRHIDQGRNVPMYNTSIPCQAAGRFSGNLVVSMRPFSQQDTVCAAEITARFPKVHGAPVHIGSPGDIGIADIGKPDYGEAVDIVDGEIPVFWACGVTPQLAVMSSRPTFCITHAPGHMLVLDIKNEELSDTIS
jgi:uncharacterized protein YcsI (UPF0317 family)